MEDSAIVALYWQRADAAIEETERKYGPYCRTVAYNILENTEDTEECVNDTWLGAWNAMPTDRPDRLGAFLGKIARRLALNRLRDKNRLKRGSGQPALALEELGDCLRSGQDPEKTVEFKELQAAIHHFLRDLKEAERDVFVSRYWYMASIEEIARCFGMGRSRVKTMLFRSREKLRVHLEKEGLL